MSEVLAAATTSPSRGRVGAVRRAGRRALLAIRVVMAVALLSGLGSLPFIPQAEHTVLGLLFSTVPGVPVSIALGTIAFVMSVRARSLRDAGWSLFFVVLLVRLPTALGVGAPIYGWTYKHLGVIDYIQQYGSVTSGVDIYSGWPGAFSAVAWFSTLTGASALTIAQWFIVAANIALVGAVVALGRAFGMTRMQSVVAGFVAHVANWVGQDYLSPQAVAFLLGLAVLVLLLRSRRWPGLGWLALPLFAAITVTHQLTPVWLTLAVLALGVLGRVRPRYIGVLFAVMVAAYVFWNRDSLSSFTLLGEIDPLANASTTVSGTGSIGQAVTSLAARLLTATLWATAGIVVLANVFGRRARRLSFYRPQRAMTLAAAALAFSPFVLLFAQNYGGEALFRVFLYSIPGCALLLARPVERLLMAGTTPAGSRVTFGSLLRSVTAVLVTLGLGLASSQASYGAWFSGVASPAAVTAGEELLRTMPVPSLIVSPVPVGPGRMVAQYAAQAAIDPLYDSSFSTWEGWLGSDFEDPDATAQLTTDLAASDRPVYLFITAQMTDYSDYLGLYPDGALARFSAQVRSDPRWEVIVDDPAVHVYRLRRE
jgi:hypothetical protein